MKTIEEKLASNPRLQEIIERVCYFKINTNTTTESNSYSNPNSGSNSRTNSSTNSSNTQEIDEQSIFTTTVLSNNTSYALKNSIILDSGAIAPVCNN